jgi:RNA polymerase sigma factor (sigma-70 family)
MKYMENTEKIKERNKLAEDNLRLAASRVYKLNNGVFSEDLYQIGCLALVKAAGKYDETIGKFSTFAVKYIDCDIMKYKYKKEYHVKLNEINFSSLYEINESGGEFENNLIFEINFENFIKQQPQRVKKEILLRIKGLTMAKIGAIIGVSQVQVSRDLIRTAQKYKAYVAMKTPKFLSDFMLTSGGMGGNITNTIYHASRLAQMAKSAVMKSTVK